MRSRRVPRRARGGGIPQFGRKRIRQADELAGFFPRHPALPGEDLMPAEQVVHCGRAKTGQWASAPSTSVLPRSGHGLDHLAEIIEVLDQQAGFVEGLVRRQQGEVSVAPPIVPRRAGLRHEGPQADE